MMALLKALFPSAAPFIVAVIAGLAGWVGGYATAHRAVSAQCQVDGLNAELKEIKRQLGVARAVNDAAIERAEADEHAMIELEGKVKEYEDAILEQDSCTLDADDVRRLRNIK